MSAAANPKMIPLFEEGKGYWNSFGEECRRQMQEINAVVAGHGLTDPEQLVQWDSGSEIKMLRCCVPSTSIQAYLTFHAWGPMISGSISGHQDEDFRFSTEEFEMMLAMDLDGKVVAVFDEGKSFSPEEFASYLTQHFRRCFPGISLPCREIEIPKICNC
jgi:hypothetical protein